MRRRYSAVGITDDRRIVVLFPTEARNSSFHQNIQINFGPTQPPLQAVLGFSPIKKRPDIKAEHSSLFSTKVKNTWNYTSTIPICLHDLDRNDYIYIFIYVYICVCVCNYMALMFLNFCLPYLWTSR